MPKDKLIYRAIEKRNIVPQLQRFTKTCMAVRRDQFKYVDRENYYLIKESAIKSNLLKELVRE